MLVQFHLQVINLNTTQNDHISASLNESVVQAVCILSLHWSKILFQMQLSSRQEGQTRNMPVMLCSALIQWKTPPHPTFLKLMIITKQVEIMPLSRKQRRQVWWTGFNEWLGKKKLTRWKQVKNQKFLAAHRIILKIFKFIQDGHIISPRSLRLQGNFFLVAWWLLLPWQRISPSIIMDINLFLERQPYMDQGSYPQWIFGEGFFNWYKSLHYLWHFTGHGREW